MTNKSYDESKGRSDLCEEQHIEIVDTAALSGSAKTENEKNDSESNRDETSTAHAPKLSNPRFVMIMIGFGMAFVGSQFVTLIFASLVTVVSNDLKAGKNLIWLFSSNLVATGITAPFAGVIADLFGRKPVTITGSLGSMVGMILCASTPNANGYIAGQVFVGFGIAIQELMAIAAIAELVPTKQRGFYAAIVVSTFIPFAPASLYGQVISEYNWRWNACFVAIWNFITALIIAIFYNPKARTNTATLSRSEILRRIDYIGGILMTAGLIFLLIGLNWGGQAYPWKTTRVICFVVLGCCLIIVFLLYEAFIAKWPMFPRRLIQHPRPFMALMAVILLAGVNYIPILIFWTMQSSAVYQSTRLETGIRTLPFGCCIMGGSIISAILISSFKGHLRLVMTISCIIQAAGIACMSAVDPYNITTVWAPLVLGLTGVGGVLIPNEIIVTIISPDDLIATATSLTICLRSVGQVIGLSILYTQFITRLTSNALIYIVPAAVEVGIYNATEIENLVPAMLGTSFADYVSLLPQVNTEQKYDLLLNAITHTFGITFPLVYYISIAFGISACIASLFIGDLTKLMDDHIAVPYF